MTFEAPNSAPASSTARLTSLATLLCSTPGRSDSSACWKPVVLIEATILRQLISSRVLIRELSMSSGSPGRTSTPRALSASTARASNSLTASGSAASPRAPVRTTMPSANSLASSSAAPSMTVPPIHDRAIRQCGIQGAWSGI